MDMGCSRLFEGALGRLYPELKIMGRAEMRRDGESCIAVVCYDVEFLGYRAVISAPVDGLP